MRSNTRRLFFLILLSTLFSLSLARDTITPTQPLADGETLISSGGSFALGFFTPTDSLNRYIGIWYNNIKSHTIVWVANRRHPITDSTGNLSITGGNGSLIIANHNSTIIWSWSTTSVLTNPVAQLLDNGNFVVKESNTTESFAWQSFDYPTDTLLPGMKLGLNLTSGLNRNITAWKSDDDPSPGEYCIAMDIRGDPQLAFWVGSVREWRSGPWNGLQFSGVPETRTFSGFAFEFVDSKEEIYYSYNMVNRSIITRLVVNQSGTTQRFVWLDGTNTWSLFWYTPKSQCDGYAICGPYGVCNPNESPICSCIQGFEPKSPQDWNLRDGSGGCVRKTALDCRNGTDGFITLSGALIPDTVSATVNMDMNVLDECRAMCLSNCSCTGYARAYVNGSGCIIWATELVDVEVFLDGGQDIYIRMAAADLGSTSGQSKKGKQVAVAIVVSVVLGTLLLACIGSCIWIRKKERRRGKSSFHEENDISTKGGELELPLFDLGTIAAATENFSEQNKLGEGGFGPVYKGKLGEGLDIAVKRLSKTSIQGIDEFKNEVMLIAKLQHRNLVRLLGCCIQGEEKMLIYEYMLNKSLDAYLFDKSKGVLLDWQTRYHIILGIARGLLYLHQDSRFRIIHRDLKASNILLDREMNPKISDFGMARIFGGDETKAKTRKVVGTYGYMSPEYAMDGIFSIKSDVFSFGVLILEIISGRKNKGVYLSEPHMYLLGHAWSLWKEGNSLEIIDTSLGSSFSMTEVLRCINVGLMCVQERPEDRPTMSSVVMMLGSDAESLPEPKQPGFAVRSGLSEVELPSSKQESCTINDVTLTMFAGR